MGIPVKAGRAFDHRDREGTLRVAIVDEQAVAKWFGGRRPLGERVTVRGEARTVVGVVGGVRAFHLNVAPAPTVYVPFLQEPTPAMAFIVRGAGETGQAVAAVKRALQAADPDQAVRAGEAYAALIERSLGGFDITVGLVLLMASAAVALAALGLYSVVAFWAECRRRETAIRIAMGASPARVTREIVAGGLRLALRGGAAGLVLSLAAGKLLVMLVVMAASYGPARRAARADPRGAMAGE
jgi:hypothetical protein